MRRGQTLLPTASPPATTAHLPSRFLHQTGFLFPIFHRFHARFRPHLAPALPAAHPKSRLHWKHLPFRRNPFHFYSNCFEFFQIQRHGSPPAMAVCALHFSKAHTPLQIPVLLSLHIYSNLIPCCIPPGIYYFVPKIRSPASPSPGQIYAASFNSRSKCPT